MIIPFHKQNFRYWGVENPGILDERITSTTRNYGAQLCATELFENAKSFTETVNGEAKRII